MRPQLFSMKKLGRKRNVAFLLSLFMILSIFFATPAPVLAETPTLTITPELTTMEVNLRNMLTISLKDALGNDVIATSDVIGYMNGGYDDEFYADKADVEYDNQFTIPATKSNTTIYYRPTTVGTKTVNTSGIWYEGGYIDSVASPEITVNPASAVQSPVYINIDSNPLTAGIPGKMEIQIQDQYGNPVAQTAAVDVALKAVTGDSTIPAGGKFYAADSNGNPITTTEINKITIDQNASGATFYYKDNKATSADYTVTVIAATPGLDEFSTSIDISPDIASTVELTAESGNVKTTLAPFIINAVLRDQYGNVANPQQGPLTLTLNPSSATGKFYSDELRSNPISQITFEQDWYSSGNSKTFYYYDSAPGTVTVTATTTDFTPGTINLTVIEPPVVKFELVNPLAVHEVNLTQPVKISLQDNAGAEWNAPWDVCFNLIDVKDDQGMSIGWFEEQSANNYSETKQITIPAGSSSIEFYYRPSQVGKHVMRAETNDLGYMPVESAEFEVSPAAQVYSNLQMDGDSLTAGVAGKITVVSEDQYGNPVAQPAGGLTVNLTAAQTTVDESGNAYPLEGKLYGAGTDGNVDTSKEITTVIIPAGQSSASFYYYDTHATNDTNYKVVIKADAGNLEACSKGLQIDPAMATKAKVTPSNVNPALAEELANASPAPEWQDAKAVYDKFALEVELLDEFGNKAYGQGHPVTIDLVTSSNTGKFYGDEDLSNRISQVTYPEDWEPGYNDQSQIVYYVDSEPSELTTLTAATANTPTMVSGIAKVKVLPLPQDITVETSVSSWLINQRGKVTVKLWDKDLDKLAAGDVANEYTVPAELKDGLNIQLAANPDGCFFTAQVGGEQLTDRVLNIPTGKKASEMDVFFAPVAAGTVQLSAGLSYDAGSVISGNSADIIWLLDHSGSMMDDQECIAQNITDFVNQLSAGGVNYNLGLIHYADGFVNPDYFNNGLFTSDANEFANCIMNQTSTPGGSGEVTMQAVREALNYPFTSSAKYIIVVTDEPGDDNYDFSVTLASANAADAIVYAIWDSSVAGESNIDELAYGTGGMDVPLYSDWGLSMSTLATDIISHTNRANIQGTLNISASAAGAVRAILESTSENGLLEFTAGKLGQEVTIKLVDQYDNPAISNGVKVNLAALDVDAYEDIDEGEPSATGMFYLETDSTSGSPVPIPITSVTIPSGSSSVKVYYYDTRATGWDVPAISSTDVYQLFLRTDSAVVDGVTEEAIVIPQSSTRIDLAIREFGFFLGDVPFTSGDDGEDYRWMFPTIDGDQTKIAPDTKFPVLIRIVDQLGNPVTQSSPLTINLATVSKEGSAVNGKFYADYQCITPITQITIAADRSYAYCFYKAAGTGSASLQGSVVGLTADSFDFDLAPADRLAIHFPGYIDDAEAVLGQAYKDMAIDYIIERDNASLMDYWHEDDNAQPEERKPFMVTLTNSQGQPIAAAEDTLVTLTGGSFYLNKGDYVSVSEVTIKKGFAGRLVYIEAKNVEGPMLISAGTAAAGIAASPEVAVQVIQQESYNTHLLRGWNILSTPLQLKRNTLRGILKDTGAFELGYCYDSQTKTWVEATLDTELEPMQAVYIKLKGDSEALFYPDTVPSGPYTKSLVQGWNLIGPGLDISNRYDHHMPVNDVLTNLEGSYSQVVSPALGMQHPWVYLPDYLYSEYYETPCMIVGKGYWIYMQEPATLPSFSYTPVNGSYRGYIPYLESSDVALSEGSSAGAYSAASVTDTPPPLPAALYGTVTDTNGNKIESGTIKAVVDGIVRGSIDFTNGQFGISTGVRLLVQNSYNLGSRVIKFLVNDKEAQETIRWSDASGQLVEFNLTVDSNAPLAVCYQAIQVVNGNTVKLTFNQDIVNNLASDAALKDAITFSAGGNPFAALTADDQVSIEGNNLVITFKNAFTGGANAVKVSANAVKGTSGAILAAPVETATFTGNEQVIDECFIATAAFGSKFAPSVALLRSFRDRFLLTNSLGTAFVDFYYKNSPPIARYIAGNEVLKGLVRIALIPFIAAAYLMFHPVLLCSLLVGLILLFVYRRRRVYGV